MEEVFVDKTRCVGATVAIEDADVGSQGRSEDLTLVLQIGIGLNDGHGEFTGTVRLQVHVPNQSITTTTPSPQTLPNPRSRHISICICDMFKNVGNPGAYQVVFFLFIVLILLEVWSLERSR